MTPGEGHGDSSSLSKTSCHRLPSLVTGGRVTGARERQGKDPPTIRHSHRAPCRRAGGRHERVAERV